MINEINVKDIEIKKILEKVNNSDISSIKQTITWIVSVINDPNSSAKDLKDVIEKDPPLSAKLLRLANSAFYGYSRTINEIQEAIICIGFEAVKELALRQKVYELFDNYDYLHGYSRISLWKHSIAVALCSKLIFRREFFERGENMYVAGLLHDIGIIIIDQFLHTQFKEILKKSKSDKNNLLNTEKDVLGFNHTDIGSEIAKNWGFHEEIVMSIENHHYPERVDNEFSKIVSTIFISDYACQSENIGYCDATDKNKTLFHKCLTKLNIKEKAIKLIIKNVKEEIKKMEEEGFC